MEISAKPCAIYKTGGRTKPSVAVTIPKAFAEAMGLLTKKKVYVMMRLTKETNNNKKVYCTMEKLE
jgi:hypothetical protein